MSNEETGPKGPTLEQAIHSAEAAHQRLWRVSREDRKASVAERLLSEKRFLRYGDAIHVLRVVSELVDYVPPILVQEMAEAGDYLTIKLEQAAEAFETRQLDAIETLLSAANSVSEFIVTHRPADEDPLEVAARVSGGAGDKADEESLRSALAEARGHISELETRAEALQAELEARAQLVDAQREAVSESGARELSKDFEVRGTAHLRSFRQWALALMLAVSLGGTGGVLFVYLTRPSDDATNAEIATHAILDILVLGLIIFLMRFVAIQARAHRHMQFVTTNKADALSTFNRMVAGHQEPEVRASVAAALAQAVFKSDDGIFSDASSDTVTFIERLGAAVTSRPPSL